MNLSPLILGKVTQWQPAHNVDRRGEQLGRPGWTMFVATLAMALLAVMIAVWVYRSSSWSPGDAATLNPKLDVLPPFEAEKVHDSVAATLRSIEVEENQT